MSADRYNKATNGAAIIPNASHRSSNLIVGTKDRTPTQGLASWFPETFFDPHIILVICGSRKIFARGWFTLFFPTSLAICVAKKCRVTLSLPMCAGERGTNCSSLSQFSSNPSQPSLNLPNPCRPANCAQTVNAEIIQTHTLNVHH